MSKRTDEWLVTAICTCMLAVGGLAWWLHLRPELGVDASALRALPRDLAGWHAEDVPLDAVIESMLQADLHVQRRYAHPLGDTVWLYVGYYGTRSGGRPEHVPRTCYEAQGWRVTEERSLEVDAARGLRANEMLVERAGERRLVHFWYRSHRRTGILGGLGISLDHLLGRTGSGRADGALVRVSTRLAKGEDPVAARARLMGFASDLDVQIAAHWPIERAAGG